MKPNQALLIAALALGGSMAFLPAAQAAPVCVQSGTNCVEVAPSPGFCVAQYYKNPGGPHSYLLCSYATGMECAGATYDPNTGSNTGVLCVWVLPSNGCLVAFGTTDGPGWQYPLC